jgi:exoribonuclease R
VLERRAPERPRLDPFAEFDAVLAVSAATLDESRRVQKAARRLPRLLERQAGVAKAALADPEGRAPGEPVLVGITLAAGARAETVVESAARALAARRRLRVVGASYLRRGAAGAEPGARTLRLLERFTVDGPAPAARGDAYLYAQGAKTLPPELEAAAAAAGDFGREPPMPREERARAGWQRTALLRRGGQAFVLLPDGDSGERRKRLPVEESFVEGLPSETLVDVRVRHGALVEARPVLDRAHADVVIGRARRTKSGVTLLEPLLRDQGQPAALYARLPLRSEDAADGTIVQALVRRSQAGAVEAVPLLDLGPELTPEIAVREIALRRGARAYFPRDVVEQAEGADEAQGEGPLQAREGFEDLRALPFVTIDPEGAGDLDDAFFIERHADGGYTWILATADVARYVSPGTPAFRQAARLGNTFYSIDKAGVSDYPMNHPVVAKSLSSLLAGKDSYAMVTRMRFDASGRPLAQGSGVGLGLVRVRGRYTYDEVADAWKAGAPKRLNHGPMIGLARELAAKLRASDERRGELSLEFDETARLRGADGWRSERAVKDPVVDESHRLIAALKVYGNRQIAGLLTRITKTTGVPHLSRVHPKDARRDERARRELAALGVPWPKGQSLADYLVALRARKDVSHEAKQLAQVAALRSRSSARYAVVDSEGHDGLALSAGEYDHPSAPIRRFSDMYNRALLETHLEGGDVAALHAAILADLRALGFDGLEDFVEHLNGREQASRQMEYEVGRFMDAWELAQPRNQGRPLRGYVRSARVDRGSGAAFVEIQLEDPPVSLTRYDRSLSRLKPLDPVTVVVGSADPAKGLVQAQITSP